MQKLLKPIFLICFITIPQALLAIVLAISYFNLRKAPSTIIITALLIHLLINIFVMIYYFKNKDADAIPISPMKWLLGALITTFCVTVVMLFQEFSTYSFISPETIYVFLNVISLLYITLCISTQIDKLHIGKQAAICLAFPVIVAIMSNGINIFSFRLERYLFMLSIGLFCAFLFYLIRLIYTLIKRKTNKTDEELVSTKMKIGNRIFVFIAAVIMPVVGLMLNNGDAIYSSGGDGVFGNFSNIWFYIIAVANGVLMLCDTSNKKWSLVLLYFKIVGFVYITYFTIVFIPIIPIGFLALAFYGIGIFAFVPATVFVAEIMQIVIDVKKLKTNFGLSIIIAIVLGAITLPTVMAVDFYIDRLNFKNALTYLNATSSSMPTVNIKRLKRPLMHIDNALGTRRDNDIFNRGLNIPIISKFYQIVAIEDKLLSTDNLEKLSKIFFNENKDELKNFTLPQNQNVTLSNATTTTEFDEKTATYKTWVDLEIKNNSNMNLTEYKTEFSIPDGCFIKDYYLYVGADKKQGILADKRAALITYNNIIRTPKDPGIIYYKSDSILSLNVYPFAPNQTRKTGFLVMHSQNETINIDGKEINLIASKPINEPIDMQGASFIPASYKKNLPIAKREAKYYFLIDASENSPYKEHIRKIKEFSENNKINDAKIYAVSYKISEFNENNFKSEAGFNLSFAMEWIFSNTKTGEFPIIIAVTDNITKASLFEKSHTAKLYPESEYYYNLDYDLSLTPYSFSENKKLDTIKAPIISSTLLYKNSFLSDKNKSEIVQTSNTYEYTDNEYQNAFILQEKSLNSSENSLIRDSFRQKLLTRQTAFTVLETAEQEKSLLDLQEKFLDQKQQDAPAVMMSEPSFILYILIAFLILFYKQKSNHS